jgi:hypothetical protein
LFFVGTIDRQASIIVIEPFVLANMIASPKGTTHYKIISVSKRKSILAGDFCCFSSETAIQP